MTQYNSNSTSSMYQCYKCNQWIGNLQFHQCVFQDQLTPYQPYNPFPGTITKYLMGKQLSEYSLQELIDELKRRKNAQDVKVKELEAEVELQKKLDAMFPEEK